MDASLHSAERGTSAELSADLNEIVERFVMWDFSRWLLATLSVTIIVVLTNSQNAYAQSNPNAELRFHEYQQPIKNRPSISPYLGLVQIPGNQTGVSYFNIVRPQQRALRATGGLSQELQAVEARVQAMQRPQNLGAGNVPDQTTSAAAAISSGRMTPTGHPTSYGTLRGFPTTNLRR